MARKGPTVRTGRPQLVRTKQISPNPLNPRIFFRQEEMDALKDSIARIGIMVPLIVYPDRMDPKKFILLDGERRLKCAHELGLHEVPVNVTETPSDTENMLRMFNIHSLREQWDQFIIAIALLGLMKKLKTSSSRELSTLTGFTVGSINRSKKLLRLPKRHLNMLKEELKK